MAQQRIPENINLELVESSRKLQSGKSISKTAVHADEIKVIYTKTGSESPIAPEVLSEAEGLKAYSGDYWGTFSLEKFASASSLTYTHEDAWGWLNYLDNFKPINFRYLDENVRIWAYKEQYDNWQDTYGMDAVMAVYHSGHGGMANDGKFYAPLGSDWGGQGTTVFSDQMRLGNEEARYIFWSTCYSLRVLNTHNPIRTWNTANLGFRMLFGYETISYDNPNYGSAFWKHWNQGKSFSAAFLDASWYDISHNQAPSVVACGSTKAEAQDRLFNERYFSRTPASKNWWWWRWYNAANAATLTRNINLDLPQELLIPEFEPVNVSGKRIADTIKQHHVDIAVPRDVIANSEGLILLRMGERRFSMEADGSYDIQFASANYDNREQIPVERTVSIGWGFLRQHGINTDELLLDSVVTKNDSGGTDEGSGTIEEPCVTETILQFTQCINGLPVLLPDKGSLSITIDNDGKVTSLRNSLKQIAGLNDRFRSTPQAPEESNPITRGLDPKVALAEVWQEKLKGWIMHGRMPLTFREIPGTYEIGYSVKGDRAALVARHDIEVDCGEGYFKRYSIEAPLLQ